MEVVEVRLEALEHWCGGSRAMPGRPLVNRVPRDFLKSRCPVLMEPRGDRSEFFRLLFSYPSTVIEA